MKTAELAGVGVAFAGCVLVGFLAGIAWGSRTHQPAWAIAGLFAGLAVGAAIAFGRLLRAMR